MNFIENDLKRAKEYQEMLAINPNVLRFYEVDYAGATIGIVKATPSDVAMKSVDLCKVSHYLPQTFDPAKVNYSDKNGWRYK